MWKDTSLDVSLIRFCEIILWLQTTLLPNLNSLQWRFILASCYTLGCVWVGSRLWLCLSSKLAVGLFHKNQGWRSRVYWKHTDLTTQGEKARGANGNPALRRVIMSWLLSFYWSKQVSAKHDISGTEKYTFHKGAWQVTVMGGDV